MNTTGKDIKLSDFRGKKNVVLAFFPAAFTGG
jgi:peroxiredoxin